MRTLTARTVFNLHTSIARRGKFQSLRRSFSAAADRRLKAVMLNADRLDFDGRLRFEKLEAVATLSRHGVSDPARPEEILERVAGHAVVINKEMPIAADLISSFPSSVKLICEAGTGFNNIDLPAASAKGIAVANLPPTRPRRWRTLRSRW